MQDIGFLTLKKKKQNMLFSMFLWFIPIISINIGYWFIKQIDYAEFSKKQKQTIDIELKSMAYTSDFDFQLSKICNEFNTAIKNLIKDAKNKNYPLHNTLENQAKIIFKNQLPNFELYVFGLEHKNNKVSLIYSQTNDKSIKKYQLCATFQHLVKRNIEKQNKSQNDKKATNDTGSKILSNFLNSPFNLDAIGENLKGKTTYTLYKYEPYKFIWNFHKANDGDIYGYYILYKNDVNIEDFAKKIALSENKNTDPMINGAIRAYIPIYKGYGKAVYQNNKLKNNKYFKKWVNKVTPKNENDLNNFLINNKQYDNEIKDYRIYTYLGKDKTHLSVLLIPAQKKYNLPDWLNCLNIIYLGILSLIIIKGILIGSWPTIYLKTRFTMNYILAAFLPISLLIITSYGYLLQNAESEKLQQINKLQNCVSEFDQQKEQLHEKYKNIINETVTNPELISLLKDRKMEEAKNLVIEIFKHFEYPFKGVYFLSKSECQKITTDFDPKTNQKKLVLNKDDKALEKILAPLRRNLLSKEEKDKLDFSSAEMAYNMISDKETPSTKSDSEFARSLRFRRNDLLFSKTNDGNTELLCSDFISLPPKKYSDEIQDFCITLHAVDEETDKISYNLTNKDLAFNYPDFNFISYKKNDAGLEIFEGKSSFKLKDIKTDILLNFANKLAQNAFTQNSQVSYEYNKIYLTAIPSQKYNNLVIVAACSLASIEKDLIKKQIIFTAILLSSAFIILFCVKFSSNKILKPITILTSSLNKVSQGELNISINNDINDELGILCNNFSNMTQGLREKQTLSSLISDQALQAIKKGSLEAEEFNGVALVSDIRNFTGTCETYSPNLITKLLNKHFAEMTKIILSNGGKIYKYIGDAIESVFPEDKKYEKPAYERAFCSAVQMLLKLDEINKERSTNKEFTYKIGVGLKYGKMYSGQVGSLESRLDYSIIGDPLKEAAKLEGLSKNKPNFPLVIDEYIKEKLSSKNISFEKLPDLSNVAYLVNDKNIDFIINKYNQSSKLNTHNGSKNINNEIQKIDVNLKTGFVDKYAYIITSLFIITLTLVILLSYGYLLNTKQAYKKALAETNNLKLINRIQSSDSCRQSFENICRNIMDHCEVLIKQNAPIQDIRNYFYSAMKENECEYYILGIGSDTQICSNNFKPEQLNKLKAYPYYSFLNKFEGFSVPKERNLIDYFHITNIHKSHNAKAIKTNILNDSEPSYLFCSILNILNTAKSNEPFTLKYNNYIIISKPVDKCSSLKQIANGFCDKFNNTDIAIGKIDNKDTWITSKDYNKDLIPQDILSKYSNYTNRKDLTSNNNVLEYSNYIINIATYTFNGHNDYNLLVSQKISNNDTVYYIYICLISLFFVTILLTSKKIKNILDTRITFKLWLSIIGSSIIPICALISIFELYVVEETNIIKQRKFNEIKDFAREFEYKSSFWYPYGWQKIKEFSESIQTQEKINEYSNTLLRTKKTSDFSAEKNINDYFMHKEINKQKSDIHKEGTKIKITPEITINITSEDSDNKNSDISKEENIINLKKEKEYKNIEINHINKLVGFAPKEIVISTPQWNLSCMSIETQNKGEKEKSKISTIFIELCKKLFNMTLNKNEKLTDTAKNSFIDEGFKTLQTFFGTEFYIKIIHAINTPMTIAAGDNVIGVLNCVIPDLKKISYEILWMLWFDRRLEEIAQNYNNTLSGKNTENKIKIYPLHTVHYGETRFGSELRNRFEAVERIASYVSKSKTPLYGEYTDENGSYIYDARCCYDIPNYIMVTLANTIEEEKQIDKLRALFYISILFIIFIIVLMTNNIANDILVPINMLVNGMEHVNNEDYDYRLNYERFDELGILCSSFDQMTKSLAEKQLIGKMLSTTAQKESINESFMGSKKADCVLVYASVKNFANYMHNLPPIILLNKLRKHVEYVASAVISEGGEIDKIMGEKQLIAFHTNPSNGINECIKSACKAALKMNALEKSNELPFPIAIGISVGTVITGFLGVGEKRDFTVIGDPVNVSARISAYAEQNDYKQVLISETVYEKSKDAFEGELIGEISLKGKSEPLKIYSLNNL